jgi:LPS-assembly protein
VERRRRARTRPGVLVAAGLIVAGLLFADAPGLAQTSASSVRLPGTDVTILADRLEDVGPDNLLVATGNVEVTRGTTRLTADRVELNRATGDAVATGHVVFLDGADRLTARRIEYNLNTGTGVVYEGEARAVPYYRLSGSRLERVDDSRYVVREGVFTTCEDDPPTWSFRFGEAHADLEDWVWGRNASFWVKDLPLIPFVPFFGAAIRQERQSGFLFPRLGHSSERGYFAEVPFFWAISDSQDATLAPIGFSERGFGGRAEYRYILSPEHAGRLNAFGLYESERDQLAEGDSDRIRGSWAWRHDWSVDARLRVLADVNGVTDDQLLREYRDRLHDRATQRVESNVFLARRWDAWSAVGNAFWYQDLTTSRAVELHRLPDVRVLGVRQPVPGVPGLLYELESSYAHFVRSVGSDGQRLDLHPRLAYPIPIAGSFAVTPFVGGRLTAYDTTVTGTGTTSGGLVIEETAGDARLRRLAEAGVDVEARASRIYGVGGRFNLDSVLHTIEPRVGYAWLDGTDLIPFTGAGTPGTNRLPQWDALDALTESSRLVYSITNRLMARTVAPAGTEAVRWEAARFVLAHAYEMQNPERPLGDVQAQLIVNPSRAVSVRGDASVSPYDGLQVAITDLAVRTDRAEYFLGTRYSDPDDVNFVQAGIAGELTARLGGRYSANWDVRSGTLVEHRAGVDLRWQCWSLSIEYVARHRDDDEFRFALNLLGVGTALRSSVGAGPLGTDR